MAAAPCDPHAPDRHAASTPPACVNESHPVMRPRFCRLRAVLSATASLAACSSGPAPLPPAATAAADSPPQWNAPLPHRGELTALTAWWQQFDDPVLVTLIDAAQVASPSIASAASRIARSRAIRVAAGAALLPALDANASAQRGKQDFVSGLGNNASVGLQAAWELDLFGGRRAASMARRPAGTTRASRSRPRSQPTTPACGPARRRSCRRSSTATRAKRPRV